jgi:predicted metalloendopeptidase
MATFFSSHKRLGRHLNGNRTLSENWADFGAIVISLNALKREIRHLGLGEKEEREAIRTFFIAYAVSWRDKQRKKAVIYRIMKNVHSIPEDRVDLILPHFQEWVDAFDIKESDPLFIPVRKRLRFFSA